MFYVSVATEWHVPMHMWGCSNDLTSNSTYILIWSVFLEWGYWLFSIYRQEKCLQILSASSRLRNESFFSYCWRTYNHTLNIKYSSYSQSNQISNGSDDTSWHFPSIQIASDVELTFVKCVDFEHPYGGIWLNTTNFV